jgi:drug/metabolite transporter (DMT)-like permease
MRPFAIVLVLTSAVLHASRDFFTKRAADKQVFMWWFTAASVVINLPMLVWVLAVKGMPDRTGILIGTGVSVVHFLYWYGLAKALEHGDLSHVYPIIRSAPAIVLVVSVLFLGETTSLPGVAGIAFVVLGAYAINLKTPTLRGVLEPIRSLRHDHALQYAILTLATVCVYTIVDDRGVEYAHPIVYFFLINTFSWLLFTPYVFLTRERSQFAAVWRTSKGKIVVNGLLGLLSYLLMLTAYTLERASYVAGLRQLSVVFAVLLGGHLLRERHRSIRLCASLAIFLGALLIAVAD